MNGDSAGRSDHETICSRQIKCGPVTTCTLNRQPSRIRQQAARNSDASAASHTQTAAGTGATMNGRCSPGFSRELPGLLQTMEVPLRWRSATRHTSRRQSADHNARLQSHVVARYSASNAGTLSTIVDSSSGAFTPEILAMTTFCCRSDIRPQCKQGDRLRQSGRRRLNPKGGCAECGSRDGPCTRRIAVCSWSHGMSFCDARSAVLHLSAFGRGRGEADGEVACLSPPEPVGSP